MKSSTIKWFFFMWFATLLSKSLHINLQASCLRSNRGALNIFWRRATCFCMQARHFELKFFTIKTFLKMVKLGRQNLAHSQPICSVPSPWWKLCWMKWKWFCLGVSFPLTLIHIPWASWNGEFYSALVPSDSALHSSRGSLWLWIYVVPGFPGIVAFQLGLFSIGHEKPKLQIVHSFFQWLVSKGRWKSGTMIKS